MPILPAWVAEIGRSATPPRLAWLRGHEGGPAWLSELPAAVGRAVERWDLQLGTPYEDGFLSLVVPAVRPDGSAVVLKVQFPDRESEHEAEALRRWGGVGAVRLLGHDPVIHALLLERCEPGTHLSEVPAVALDVLVGLLPRLWLPAGPPFTSLANEARRWIAGMDVGWEAAGRPFEHRLIDEAIAALAWLPQTQGEQVLVHQDLHADNVLAARREPWLAIDPKPLVGERPFAAASIVRSFRLGHSRRAMLRRLDRLSADLGLDRERVRAWTVAQAVAWSCWPGYVPQQLQTVRWLLER